MNDDIQKLNLELCYKEFTKHYEVVQKIRMSHFRFLTEHTPSILKRIAKSVHNEAQRLFDLGLRTKLLESVLEK